MERFCDKKNLCCKPKKLWTLENVKKGVLDFKNRFGKHLLNFFNFLMFFDCLKLPKKNFSLSWPALAAPG